MHQPHLPLRGPQVLELGSYIAAPTTGRLLADFGAEVIKVERPRTGDELRNWRLYSGTTPMLYRTINRNKKSVVLDLKSPKGRAAALRLAGESDVVLENFRPGTLEKWGLGPAQLDAANPDIVIVRIRRSASPDRSPTVPASRPWPKPWAGFELSSANPTGGQHAQACRSATRSPDSTAHSAP